MSLKSTGSWNMTKNRVANDFHILGTRSTLCDILYYVIYVSGVLIFFFLRVLGIKSIAVCVRVCGGEGQQPSMDGMDRSMNE